MQVRVSREARPGRPARLLPPRGRASAPPAVYVAKHPGRAVEISVRHGGGRAGEPGEMPPDLSTYRSKRDFARTPEPAGGQRSAAATMPVARPARLAARRAG